MENATNRESRDPFPRIVRGFGWAWLGVAYGGAGDAIYELLRHNNEQVMPGIGIAIGNAAMALACEYVARSSERSV